MCPPSVQVARELGTNVNTLYTWYLGLRNILHIPLSETETSIMKIPNCATLKSLEEENEFLKKQASSLWRTWSDSLSLHGSQCWITKMAKWLQVSKSEYYAWRKRSPSAHEMENESFLKETLRIHEASHSTYGSKKIAHEMNCKSDKSTINR